MVCALCTLGPAVLVKAIRTSKKPPLETESTLPLLQTIGGLPHSYVFLAFYVIRIACIFVPTACDTVADMDAMLASL